VETSDERLTGGVVARGAIHLLVVLEVRRVVIVGRLTVAVGAGEFFVNARRESCRTDRSGFASGSRKSLIFMTDEAFLVGHGGGARG